MGGGYFPSLARWLLSFSWATLGLRSATQGLHSTAQEESDAAQESPPT